MRHVGVHDVSRMRDELLFDGEARGAKLSRFWALLVLAAVIATAGIVGDSTATVIGAMIVAPLMTPIIGTVLAVVCGDVPNLVRCLLLVVTGAAAVVAIAWAVGNLVSFDVLAETNAQVSARVHPRLIDLVAALATGAVGAFAIVRSDVSDTLPGVAIAISLVPPLAVVGLTLESGRPHQSVGALLLFLTNVAAILLSGLVVMALYRVGAAARAVPRRARLQGHAATLVVVVVVVALAVPLAAASGRFANEERHRRDVGRVAEAWAKERGWSVVNVDAHRNGVVVHAIGPLPIPDPQTFREALDARGLHSVGVQLELVPARRATLPGA
jgi:uncharacterized hydrophobic protein (TIGR00271 family)